MLTTRSTSGNSKRWGTSASRSFGPMSGSESIIENTSSMHSRNSFGESNEAPIAYEALFGERPVLVPVGRLAFAGVFDVAGRDELRLPAAERRAGVDLATSSAATRWESASTSRR